MHFFIFFSNYPKAVLTLLLYCYFDKKNIFLCFLTVLFKIELCPHTLNIYHSTFFCFLTVLFTMELSPHTLNRYHSIFIMLF